MYKRPQIHCDREYNFLFPLSSSFQDGMAFCAFAHCFDPTCFDYDGMDRSLEAMPENIRKAFAELGFYFFFSFCSKMYSLK